MTTWKTSSLNLKTFTVQKELKDDWENWTERRASGTSFHYFVDVKLVTHSTTWLVHLQQFLWPELNWLCTRFTWQVNEGREWEVGVQLWAVYGSCYWKTWSALQDFLFSPLSGSHAHGRMELESCVCVCAYMYTFCWFHAHSNGTFKQDASGFKHFVIWYTNVNPCCLQHFRCAFGSVLSPFTMGCLQLQPTEASNSWNQVFTFTLDSLQLF